MASVDRHGETPLHDGFYDNPDSLYSCRCHKNTAVAIPGGPLEDHDKRAPNCDVKKEKVLRKCYGLEVPQEAQAGVVPHTNSHSNHTPSGKRPWCEFFVFE